MWEMNDDKMAIKDVAICWSKYFSQFLFCENLLLNI